MCHQVTGDAQLCSSINGFLVDVTLSKPYCMRLCKLFACALHSQRALYDCSIRGNCTTVGDLKMLAIHLQCIRAVGETWTAETRFLCERH